ncbi:MAG: hypothetical protein RLZZ338_130, partial [Cyanobacteriota bacterium]
MEVATIKSVVATKNVMQYVTPREAANTLGVSTRT